MALSVIGSGFGRTGTASLKAALEQLGFGPCHHMHEVNAHPEQRPWWQSVASGETVDWNTVFAGYGSQVDWPGAHVWRQLIVAFPEAKVLHSVRPEDSWWRSFSNTIGKLMTLYPGFPLPPAAKAMMDANTAMIGHQTFGGNWTDRDHVLAVYNQRTAEVVATVPPERLLVYDVAEGWEPLCRFLNAPVPETPFPRTNTQSDFWSAFVGEPK